MPTYFVVVLFSSQIYFTSIIWSEWKGFSVKGRKKITKSLVCFIYCSQFILIRTSCFCFQQKLQAIKDRRKMQVMSSQKLFDASHVVLFSWIKYLWLSLWPSWMGYLSRGQYITKFAFSNYFEVTFDFESHLGNESFGQWQSSKVTNFLKPAMMIFFHKCFISIIETFPDSRYIQGETTNNKMTRYIRSKVPKIPEVYPQLHPISIHREQLFQDMLLRGTTES